MLVITVQMFGHTRNNFCWWAVTNWKFGLLIAKHACKILILMPVANHTIARQNRSGFPLLVSGVPPDAFSETGQLWGRSLLYCIADANKLFLSLFLYVVFFSNVSIYRFFGYTLMGWLNHIQTYWILHLSLLVCLIWWTLLACMVPYYKLVPKAWGIRK